MYISFYNALTFLMFYMKTILASEALSFF